MLRSTLNYLFVILGLVFGVMALVGCGDEAPPASETAKVGKVSAALVTTGLDGATYRFPATSGLVVQSGQFTDFIPLDSPDLSVTRTLPAGSYTAAVFPSPVQLERTLGTTTTLVDATALNSLPISFDVIEGQTTLLSLRFSVRGLGDVTFDMGSVLISLNVQRTTTETPSQLTEQGTAVVNQITFDPSATEAAQTLFALDVGEALEHDLVMQVTGEWVLRSPINVCINGQLTEAATPSPQGFAPWLAQLVGAPAVLCVNDNGTSEDMAYIQVFNSITLPEHQEALPGNNQFFLELRILQPGNLFDGVHLAESLLEAVVPPSEGGFSYFISNNDTGVITARLETTLTGRFRLLP